MTFSAIARGVLVISLVVLPAPLRGQPPLLQSITLRSGNGPVGTTDPQISMLVGPANTPFAAPFAAADFVAASNGPSAFIINGDPAWSAGLPSDPSARWIATVTSGFNQGSALYAIDFLLPPTAFASATLTLDYLVDNSLGSSVAPGVYLNGTPLSGNTFLPTCAAAGCPAYLAPQTMVRSDIAPLLQPGTNTLYVYGNDTGVVAGLLFSATLDLFGFANPEYETNSGASSLDVNGVQGTAFTPATVTVPVATLGTFGLSSVNVGQPWDLGSGLAPLIPASSGALLLPDGQILNLDLSDPTLAVWFNLLQGPAWGPQSSLLVPFSIAAPTMVSAQMVVMDPGVASGLALSQPVRVIVQ